MSGRDDKPVHLAQYAALSNFLRGYLHEDSAVEYGSPRAAAQAFRKDADESQTAIVRAELDHLLQVTSPLPESQLIRILENDLGCRRRFHSRKEVEQLRDALQ
jgi:contact-dependent growth inhibition (CDI) system CdiI-like immunity protein